MRTKNVTSDDYDLDYSLGGHESTVAPAKDATVGLGTGGNILNVYDGATYEVGDYLNLNAGTINITDGGTINVDMDLTNANGGTVNINGGTLNISNNLNANYAVFNITNGKLSVGHDFNGNDAVFNINSGGVLDAGSNYTNLNSATFNIRGGTVELAGISNIDSSTSSTFNFHNVAGGQIVIKSTSLSDISGDSLNITNFVYGDQIKIDTRGSNYSSDTITSTVSGDNLLIQATDSDGKTTTLVTIKDYASSGLENVSPAPTATYSDGYLLIGEQSATGACFLSGSLIQTPSDIVTVEDLSVGDEIIAYVDGVTTPRRVIWTGQAHCVVRSHLPDDEAGYPVRILKDAIADGVPFKDMLITAEHCLFFDGKFVPARMLVNGRSIFFDKSVTSYDYYHIETEAHSVVMADGILTESYLDTGNRRAFSQKGNVVSIGGSRNLTWDDAAAPLGVSREFAEPLFRQAEARAIAAGITQKDTAPELTEEANLHLITDTGVSIRPAREHNGRIMFMIPTGVQSIRIASNASRPSDVVGPFVDDRRYFGVAVGDITLFEGNRSRTITSHLTDRELDGWNTLEWEDCRWTSGNGLLPLGERHPNSVALIAIQIRKTGPYLATDTVQKKAALRA